MSVLTTAWLALALGGGFGGLQPAAAAPTASVCAGTTHASRTLASGWHQGCATGYSSREAQGQMACTGTPLIDSAYTVAVSPLWTSWIQCGARIKICYTRCVVARRTDTGPCWSPCDASHDLNRDFDMSRGTALAIGRSPLSWFAPNLVRWHVLR
jgi:hypothetical protein